jgi:AraC family transcriptional activator of pobA
MNRGHICALFVMYLLPMNIWHGSLCAGVWSLSPVAMPVAVEPGFTRDGYAARCRDRMSVQRPKRPIHPLRNSACFVVSLFRPEVATRMAVLAGTSSNFLRETMILQPDSAAENAIRTYDVASFRDRFMQTGQPLNSLLKIDFGKFFVVKVEELFRLMKLPVPPTRATTHTLIYLTEGEAIMTIGSETCKIGRDECMIVPAGQVFSFTHPDVNRGYLCNFHNDMIIGKFGKNDLLRDFEFLRVWGNPRICLDERTSGFVLHLFKRLLLEYTEHGLKNLNILQPYFIALLCEINSAYKPVSGSSQTHAVHITNRFRELIFSSIKTVHSVADYAALLNITPNHLNKSVRTITGKSPTKWIDEAIVLEAKVLLCQSDLPISEIAAEVGFFDQSYFSRLFKKYEGVTPVQFRKMIEKS